MPSAVPPTRKEREKSGTEADGEMKSHDIAILEKAPGPGEGKSRFSQPANGARRRCARTETKRQKAPDDMNAAPGFRLGRLAGLPRTCARYASSEAVAAAAAPVAAAAVAKPVAKPPPEGHGQKIWVHANRLSDNVVYSFKPAVEVRRRKNSRGWEGRSKGEGKSRIRGVVFKCLQQ